MIHRGPFRSVAFASPRHPIGSSRAESPRHTIPQRWTWATWMAMTLIGGMAGHELCAQSPEAAVVLQSPDVRESSGLAVSRLNSNVLWTHNDSGDGPRLFAFDRTGRHLGTCRVTGADALDWEDMASFRSNGRACLLIADVGNNDRERKQGCLYVVEEKSPEASELPLLATIPFQFEDGVCNCEAVAVDPVRREYVFVTKDIAINSRVYVLPWPRKTDAAAVPMARRVAKLELMGCTGLDISPDGGRAVVLTYGDAYEFQRRPDGDWGEAFGKPGRRIPLPHRKQGEAICYDADGTSLYLTSEHAPTPLFRVPLGKDR